MQRQAISNIYIHQIILRLTLITLRRWRLAIYNYVRGYVIAGGVTYYGNELPMAIFYYTGAEQTFPVPAGVTSATIKVLGAKGGGSYYSSAANVAGGNGASMKGTFAVTPGEDITVIVGQRGGDGYPLGGPKGGGGGGGSYNAAPVATQTNYSGYNPTDGVAIITW